jgi:hypothetical protein
MPLPRPDGIRARLRHDLAPLVVLPRRSPSQRLLLPLPPWMPPPPHTVAAGTNPPPQASFCEVISSTLCMKSIDLCYLFFVPLFIALISLGLIQSIRDLIPCTSMQY